MEDKEYTQKDFKEFKRMMGLKNRDLSRILGMSFQSIQKMTSPHVKVPRWAIGMMWTRDKIKSKNQDR